MTAVTTGINRETARYVRPAHEDAIRRVMGAAYARIAASGERVKAALRMHHSAVSHRKSGSGPLANAGVEIDALERDGIITDPLTEALDRIQLAARGPVCITTAIRAEADADAEEDRAAAEYMLGVPGSAERWAESLIRQAAASRNAARAILAGGTIR